MKGVVSNISKIILRSFSKKKIRWFLGRLSKICFLESCGCSTSDFFWGANWWLAWEIITCRMKRSSMFNYDHEILMSTLLDNSWC